MSLRTEWPCWEIMKCDESQECPAKESSSKLCWEIIKEVDNLSFNICMDCLVYISQLKDSQFSEEELLSIMAQKGVNVLNGKQCPNFKGCPKEQK